MPAKPRKDKRRCQTTTGSESRSLPYCRVYEGAIPLDLCRRLIDAFESDHAGQIRGHTIGGYDPETKNSTDLRVGERAWVEQHEGWQELDREVFEVVRATWQDYHLNVAKRLAGPFEDSGYQLQRYTSDAGRFAPHVDSATWTTAFRVGAAILYLNDVPHGGETEFPELGLSVAPRAGNVLWFPATFTHVHEGRVPRGSHKYIISTFMCYAGFRQLLPGGTAHDVITSYRNGV